MVVKRDGFIKNDVFMDEETLRKEYKRVWHKGAAKWQHIHTLEVCTIFFNGEYYEAVPVAPICKIGIYFNPFTHSLKTSYAYINEEKQELINTFLLNVFQTYAYEYPKSYQVHVRFASDWELRKISVIDDYNHIEGATLTWLLSQFFKHVIQGTSVYAFLKRYNLEGLLP